MTQDVTVTDIFCGAGGSTTGANQAGASVRLAINHWKRAIETHNTNYPNVDHVLTDISQSDPRRYPATTILIASPECTNHTLANGKKRKGLGQATLWDPGSPIDPAEERSRCTMFDPLRFAEQHQYRAVILENVVDARNWRMWDAWLHGWQSLDYDFETVYFNSQFAHPTPQSRDRMYFVAWKRKNRKPDLTFLPAAYCQKCAKQVETRQAWKNPRRRYGKYKQQYVYRCSQCASVLTPWYYPASSAIDWSIPTPRIGDRTQLLAEKTMDRIAYGLEKFARSAPMVMQLSHNGSHAGRITPVTDVALPTQTTRDDLALVTPPFLLDHVGEYRPRAITDPCSTIVAGGNHQSLVVPPAWLMTYYRNGQMAPVQEAVPTVTTLDRHALVMAPENEKEIAVRDCGFRMLVPREIQAAMAFPREYVVTGSRREQVRQLGNAVTPPVMRLLMERVIASLQ